jgi:hypothetical protein
VNTKNVFANLTPIYANESGIAETNSYPRKVILEPRVEIKKRGAKNKNMKPNETPSYWVHDLSPFLMRFSDSTGISYYGLVCVFAFLIATLFFVLGYRRANPFRNELSQTANSTKELGG